MRQTAPTAKIDGANDDSRSVSPSSFPADSIRAQLNKILASRAFAKAPVLSRFLRFIVEEALEGRGDRLTEWVIGIDVLEIKGFDPKVHTNVRVRATGLRRGLSQYYVTEGRNDSIRIEMPRGGYRPVFRERKTGTWIDKLVELVRSYGVDATLALAVVILALVAIIPSGQPTSRHLAVLQFTNVGDDPANRSFCQGLFWGVSGRLGELERFVKRFWVTPAKIVVDSGVQTVQEAYRSFGVNLVVTGSVERAGEKVRMTVTLHNKDREPRSRTIDSQTQEPFDVQDEVVKAVIAMLELNLPSDARRTLARRDTMEPSAHDFYLRGRGYLEAGVGNADHAIALFDQALEKDPKYAQAYAGLGEAFLQKYEATKDPRWIDVAREKCNRAIGLDDQQPAVHVTLGLIHKATGRLQEAVREYELARALNPFHESALKSLAAAYEALGKLQDAEETYRNAISLRPGYWASQDELGVFYFRQGRYGEAERRFQEARRLAPDNIRAHNDLGGLYIRMGRYADGERVLRRSLDIRPNAVAYNNLSSFYFFQGRYGEAVPMMRKAIEFGANNATIWGNMARAIRWSTGITEESREAYNKAVQLAQQELTINPTNAELRSTLAVIRAELGNRKEALAEIKVARSQAPANVNVLFKSVLVYELTGDRKGALEALKATLQGGHSMQEVHTHPDLAELRKDPGFKLLAPGSAGIAN